MDESEMLASEAAREFLGVSRTTMHRLVQNGELRGLKVGGQWRFAKADLVAHLERKPVGVAAKALPELDAELGWWRSQHSENVPAESTEEVPSPEEKVVALAKAILLLALERGSSDLHFEPDVHSGRVRFRADGVLETVREMSSGLFVPVLNRLKEMGALNPEEKRVPQDGRTRLSHRDKKFDVGLTTYPTTHGEALTMRVLPENTRVQLDALGLSPEQLAQVKEVLTRPQGLVLLCGLTGSGKVTTFYTLLDSLANDSVKIVTIEDPVEADLPAISQIKAQNSANLTFAALLRAIVRADPDIIGLADVPDFDTAETAVQAALSGHLVIAQLNVLGTGTAIVRLNDLGTEPFLLGAALEGAINQTLVRRVCPDCAQSTQLTPGVSARLNELAVRENLELPPDLDWKKGIGCTKCRQSGYRGRIAMFEVTVFNEKAKSAISVGASAEEINRIARASGTKSLLKIGLEHAAQGRTTAEELIRVLAF